MIIPFTVLALAWFIVINHVHVRRVRANKTGGIGHTFFRESTQFFYRLLVVGAAFSTLAVLLMGLNNDHTRLGNLLRLQRTVEGAEGALRTVGLTPVTTFVLLLIAYALLLATRHDQLRWPGRLSRARRPIDRGLPAITLFTFIVFFASRIGDPSLDPTARIREIREGYATYRAAVRQEIAERAALFGTEQLRARSVDLRTIDGLRDSLWRARDEVLASYSATPVQAGQPLRVARVDTVRPLWTDAERQIVRRLDVSDADPFAPSLSSAVPGDEAPRSLSVHRTRELLETIAHERDRRATGQRSRGVILGDAIKEIGTKVITLFLADVPKPTIDADLADRLGDLRQVDPTLEYVPTIFLDATESRIRARLADQINLAIQSQAETEEPLSLTLDSAARSVAAELQPVSLESSDRAALERRVRAAIDDARARARAVEAARRAAAAPRQVVVQTTPAAARVDTLWEELVTLWLGSDGAGDSFTLPVTGNDALRREATRLLGREADTLTLSPSADGLRALSESYNNYVTNLSDADAERELAELVRVARAEASPSRRVQVITARALQRVPQALTAALGVR